MATATRMPRSKFSTLEKQLSTQRNELRIRVERHRQETLVDHEPDDEAAVAVENASRDMLAATLERERRTLNEIESALLRMKKGEYGVCVSCGEAIAKARLEALPWARLCIHCADRALNPNGLRVAS